MADSQRNSSNEYRDRLSSPGPFIGRIVNNIDPMRQGALEVELLRDVGNQNSANQQLYVVRYCSPFYGVSDLAVNGSDDKDFNHTQKSYGMWFVPPDIGCLVMVIFVESDPGQGYWVGCVQDAYMNHMIPGIAASKSVSDTVNDSTDQKWTGAKKKVTDKYGDNPVPVAEVNRASVKEGKLAPNAKVDDMKKPVHPIADSLSKQGTLGDPTRGTHTSSARRDTPSNVYGISTPGPLDKRNGSHKGSIGRKDSKITKFTSRMGGHSIVMDDGNDRKVRKTKPDEGPIEYVDIEAGGSGGLNNYPQDESFRIRTRTGHQILLHNSEDLIYITNSKGSAWIEFTSNGKIDIFCEDSISIHSKEDFNFVADRDINLHASRALNLFAGTRIRGQAVENVAFNAGGNVLFGAASDFSVTAGGATYISSSKGLHAKGQDVRLTSGGMTEIMSGGAMHVTSGASLNLLGAQTAISSQGTFDLLAGGALNITSASLGMGTGGNIVIKGAKVDINGPAPTTAKQAQSAVSADSSHHTIKELVLYPLPGVGSTIVKRAPSHEPWEHHENLNPPGFTSELTNREDPQMPYTKDGERTRIERNEDSQRVSSAQGGDAGYEKGNSSGTMGAGNFSRTSPTSKGATANQENDTRADPNTVYPTDYNDGSIDRMPKNWLQDEEFIAKTGKLASKYGMKLEEMMTLMFIESSCSPTAVNPNKVFVGLIQFGNQALTAINQKYKTNWNINNIVSLSRVQQLDIVEQFFDLNRQQYKIGNLTLGRMYLLQFYPAMVRDQPSAVIAYPYDTRSAFQRKVWEQNKGLRESPGGPITVASVMAVPERSVERVRLMLDRRNNKP